MDLKTFDRSHFNRMKPNPRPSKRLSLSIMADHMVRLNTLLNQKMMRETECRFLYLSFWPEGRQILLEPCGEEGDDTAVVQKGGAFPMDSICKALNESGIKLPAYFIVEQLPGEQAWVGEYIPEHRFPIQKMTPERVKKPRKNDLASMLPKEKKE